MNTLNGKKWNTKVYPALPGISRAVLLLFLALTLLSASFAEAADHYKITLITMDQMDQHWISVNEGVERAVEELGNVEYKWMAPDVKNDAQQLEFINYAVESGMDAILLAASGPESSAGALKKASEAGVKLIYIDSPAAFEIDKTPTFSTDNEAAGATAGKELLRALEAAGVTEGAIGIVNVNAATASTSAREKGFRAIFTPTRFTIPETRYGEGETRKSKDIAGAFINEGVVGLFGTNEGSSTGVGSAIYESGKKILGVGFDSSEELRELIKNGALIATMAQNPEIMGYEGLKAAISLIEDKPVSPLKVDTGVSVLTKEKM